MFFRKSLLLLILPFLFSACDPCNHVEPVFICGDFFTILIVDSNGDNVFDANYTIDSLKIVALGDAYDNSIIDNSDKVFSIRIYNCDGPDNYDIVQTADYLLKFNQSEADTLHFVYKVIESACNGNNFEFARIEYLDKSYEVYYYDLNTLVKE